MPSPQWPLVRSRWILSSQSDVESLHADELRLSLTAVRDRQQRALWCYAAFNFWSYFTNYTLENKIKHVWMSTELRFISVALLPHSKKVLGSNPGWGRASLWELACSPGFLSREHWVNSAVSALGSVPSGSGRCGWLPTAPPGWVQCKEQVSWCCIIRDKI